MEKNLWIYAHWNEYSKNIDYQLSSYERGESSGDTLIEKRSIEFDTPNDRELRIKLGTMMKVKLNYMRGEHTKAEMEVQEVINELASLEFKPDTATTETDDIPF